jgi:hypothetical protein
VFINAPLVVTNATGQRLCETHVGQRYWRWRVSANSTNTASRRLGGVALLRALEECGFRYDDGLDGPPRSGRRASECYPYTTIVGYEEFGYNQRPLYKRKPKSMRTAEFKTVRAAACAELITRVGVLADADPALDLRSHEVTRELLEEPAPLDNGRTSTEKICSPRALARGRHHSGIATASSGVRCSALPLKLNARRRRSSRPLVLSSESSDWRRPWRELATGGRYEAPARFAVLERDNSSCSRVSLR